MCSPTVGKFTPTPPRLPTGNSVAERLHRNTTPDRRQSSATALSAHVEGARLVLAQLFAENVRREEVKGHVQGQRQAEYWRNETVPGCATSSRSDTVRKSDVRSSTNSLSVRDSNAGSRARRWRRSNGITNTRQPLKTRGFPRLYPAGSPG